METGRLRVTSHICVEVTTQFTPKSQFQPLHLTLQNKSSVLVEIGHFYMGISTFILKGDVKG